MAFFDIKLLGEFGDDVEMFNGIGKGFGDTFHRGLMLIMGGDFVNLIFALDFDATESFTIGACYELENFLK